MKFFPIKLGFLACANPTAGSATCGNIVYNLIALIIKNTNL
jgi:hypothetical protein